MENSIGLKRVNNYASPLNIHKINSVSKDFGLSQNQSIVAQLEVFFSSGYVWVIALYVSPKYTKTSKNQTTVFRNTR